MYHLLRPSAHRPSILPKHAVQADEAHNSRGPRHKGHHRRLHTVLAASQYLGDGLNSKVVLGRAGRSREELQEVLDEYVPDANKQLQQLLQDYRALWQPRYREYDYFVEDAWIEGQLPQELKGTLLRCGPAPIKYDGSPLGHRHDGDAMVTSLTIDGNGNLFFRNRFVRTPSFLSEQAAGRRMSRGRHDRISQRTPSLSLPSLPPGLPPWLSSLSINLPGLPLPSLQNPLDATFRACHNRGLVYWAKQLWALGRGVAPQELHKVGLDTSSAPPPPFLGESAGQVTGHTCVAPPPGTNPPPWKQQSLTTSFTTAMALPSSSSATSQELELPFTTGERSLFNGTNGAGKSSNGSNGNPNGSNGARNGSKGADTALSVKKSEGSGGNGGKGGQRLCWFSAAPSAADTLLTCYEVEESGAMVAKSHFRLESCVSHLVGAIAVTPNFYVVPISSVSFNIDKLMTGYSTGELSFEDCHTWQPNQPLRVYLLPRPGAAVTQGAEGVMVYEAGEPLNVTGDVHAYETPEGRMVVDLIGQAGLDPDSGNMSTVDHRAFVRGPRPLLHRLSLNLNPLGPYPIPVPLTVVSDRACHHMTVNPTSPGGPYSQVYMTASGLEDFSHWGPPQVLVKMAPGESSYSSSASPSPRSGEAAPPSGPRTHIKKWLQRQGSGAQTWTPGPRCFLEPAVFLPRAGAAAEDDGWLVTVVHDMEDGRSQVVVLDALQLWRGPVAAVHLPHALPPAYHTTLTPQHMGPASIAPKGWRPKVQG